ncbi:MAG: lipopolysaccharide heptosyltransferase family protein [Deltaproteobacteria bacterium]|nr:MAG: lipopolysaccharide heptosyltransferase family protein [Deltaproteobacteria bacterium]
MRLRAKEYDAVVDIQGNLKSGLVTFFSRSPVKGGFARDGVREFPNLFFTNKKVKLTPEDIHITLKYLRVVSGTLGIDVPQGFDFYPTLFPDDKERESVRARELFGNDEVESFRIAIHHGTTWETKGISPERWRRVLETIVDAAMERGKRPEVYFTWGNEEERKQAEAIARGVRERGENCRITVTHKMSIGELIAFMSLMDLVIGPDTGPVHLAAAVGVKTISFYRVTRAERNAPRGKRHVSIQADVHCAGCLRKECPHREMCEEAIRPELFREALFTLLAEG